MYIELTGEQGMFNPENLQAAYEEFERSQKQNITLDFSNTTPESYQYDTSIVAQALEIQTRAKERGGTLTIILASDRREAFRLARLENHFNFREPETQPLRT